MDLDSWHYFFALAFCVVITLPLEFVLGARVYRQPRRLAAVLWPVMLAFVLWDVVATRRGNWMFDKEQILGVHVLGLPLEEFAFFMVIPLCGLLTYEAVGAMERRARKEGGK